MLGLARMNVCKEKFPLENLVSANMKLFGRINAVTETDGNTEKQVRLPDRIFTFPPVERTKEQASSTEYRVSPT